MRLTRSIRVPSAASWITWNSGHRAPTRAIVVRRRNPRRAPRRVLDGPIPSFVQTNDDMNRHNVVIMSSRFSIRAHPHGCPPRVIDAHRVAS